MADSDAHQFQTPTADDLHLHLVENDAGLHAAVLANGAIFALEHRSEKVRLMIGQILGSGVGGGLARILLRTGDGRGTIPLLGPGGPQRIGAAGDRIVWQRDAEGLRCRVVLWLAPSAPVWLWRVEVENLGAGPVACDVVLVQDLGLAERGFLMNNEAFACQYIDHHVARHPVAGPVIMSRQNLSQGGGHPFAVHGCLGGAAAFATDLRQVAGAAHRVTASLALPFGTPLPSVRRQGEAACAALQSAPGEIAPGTAAAFTFFGAFLADHPDRSQEADLALVAEAQEAAARFAPAEVKLRPVAQSLAETAPALRVAPLRQDDLAARYPCRTHEERAGDEMLSFFVPGEGTNRHVVLSAKEAAVLRRHGTILVSGTGWLPDDRTLSLTAWMHGVFAAQLTLGNTSLNKVFSVARDSFDLMRSGGLRILVETEEGWRRLAVPSAFEIGIWDCRWIYATRARTIEVTAAVSPDEGARASFAVTVDGAPCRFLLYGQLVLGEHELAHHGRVAIEPGKGRFVMRPAEDSAWAGQYPHARLHLEIATPECIDALGGDELLFDVPVPRTGGFAVVRTRPAEALRFAVLGSLEGAAAAEEAASAYRAAPDGASEAARAAAWRALTGGLALEGAAPDGLAAARTVLPWMIHDGRVHLAAPHGLEQYSGGAWGTRDVCQGPVELLLALRQDEAVRAILATVFAEQDLKRADWPQWFMLDPYAWIRAGDAHGDIIVWPLKALCDYLEETGDAAFLDAPLGWRQDGGARADRLDCLAVHVDRLLAAVEALFVPGTHLIRYGEGDWNDALQPADPAMREHMVSGWTVALLYRQVRRYAAILQRFGRADRAADVAAFADGVRRDFRRHLMREGTVAGYALFGEGEGSEVLFHPLDERTGIRTSLIAITEAVLAGLLTPEEIERHRALIADTLTFPDGVRLMERPLPYHGGLERMFRRGESAAYFGREIGLMYTHAHLRYAEMLASLDMKEAFADALELVNPIAVTERLAHAGLRQRNAYFSSSDADFPDRYAASRDWHRVREGTVPVEGGWRIYSSGPGILVHLLLRHGFGRARDGAG